MFSGDDHNLRRRASEQAGTIRRGANRAKRELIARFGPARRLLEYQHEQRARRHAPALHPLSAAAQDAVDHLEREAIAHPSLDDLAGADADALRKGLTSLVDGMAAQAPEGRSTIWPSDETLLSETEVWRWGLAPEMLDVAEHYLGVPVWYYGADACRQVADGKVIDLRRWHRDIEDRRVLKILMWLRDVSESDGPFAYLPVADSDEAASRLHYVSGFVSDDRMRAIIPEDRWRTCPGPAWTITYADTARLMHRAMPPRHTDRYSVTFTWTSRHPVAFRDVPSSRAANAFQPLEDLDERQRAALAPCWARVTRSRPRSTSS